MTVTITFPAETEKQLCTRAAQAGQTVEVFVRQLVERELLGSNGRQARDASAPPVRTTFDDIFAPLRKEVEASGITDEELDGLLKQARAEVWQERQAHQGQDS